MHPTIEQLAVTILPYRLTNPANLLRMSRLLTLISSAYELPSQSQTSGRECASFDNIFARH
jgi:hypothetical protein